MREEGVMCRSVGIGHQLLDNDVAATDGILFGADAVNLQYLRAFYLAKLNADVSFLGLLIHLHQSPFAVFIDLEIHDDCLQVHSCLAVVEMEEDAAYLQVYLTYCCLLCPAPLPSFQQITGGTYAVCLRKQGPLPGIAHTFLNR
jgi:hypothetical protein